MKITVLLAALCAVVLASNAEARPKHRHHHRHNKMIGCSDQVMRPCGGGGARKDQKFFFERKYARPASHMAKRRGGARRDITSGLRRVMTEGAGRVVAHPRGCPRRAFCGCGAAVRIFGKPIRSLWRAANWFRFPRTSPAPGMVAVRRHHVFVLLRHVRGKVWRVYDANSGRHRTRIHRRSISGWTIVDPRAGS